MAPERRSQTSANASLGSHYGPRSGGATSSLSGTPALAYTSRQNHEWSTCDEQMLRDLDEVGDKLLKQEPRADGAGPRRPMNAFLIYARYRSMQMAREREQKIAQGIQLDDAAVVVESVTSSDGSVRKRKKKPAGTKPSDVSAALGEEWSLLTPEQQRPFHHKAHQLRAVFDERYPDYKFTRGPKGVAKQRRLEKSLERAEQRNQAKQQSVPTKSAQTTPPRVNSGTFAHKLTPGRHQGSAFSYEGISPFQFDPAMRSDTAHAPTSRATLHQLPQYDASPLFPSPAADGRRHYGRTSGYGLAFGATAFAPSSRDPPQISSVLTSSSPGWQQVTPPRNQQKSSSRHSTSLDLNCAGDMTMPLRRDYPFDSQHSTYRIMGGQQPLSYMSHAMPSVGDHQHQQIVLPPVSQTFQQSQSISAGTTFAGLNQPDWPLPRSQQQSSAASTSWVPTSTHLTSSSTSSHTWPRGQAVEINQFQHSWPGGQLEPYVSSVGAQHLFAWSPHSHATAVPITSPTAPGDTVDESSWNSAAATHLPRLSASSSHAIPLAANQMTPTSPNFPSADIVAPASQHSTSLPVSSATGVSSSDTSVGRQHQPSAFYPYYQPSLQGSPDDSPIFDGHSRSWGVTLTGNFPTMPNNDAVTLQWRHAGTGDPATPRDDIHIHKRGASRSHGVVFQQSGVRLAPLDLPTTNSPMPNHQDRGNLSEEQDHTKCGSEADGVCTAERQISSSETNAALASNQGSALHSSHSERQQTESYAEASPKVQDEQLTVEEIEDAHGRLIVKQEAEGARTSPPVLSLPHDFSFNAPFHRDGGTGVASASLSESFVDKSVYGELDLNVKWPDPRRVSTATGYPAHTNSIMNMIESGHGPHTTSALLTHLGIAGDLQSSIGISDRPFSQSNNHLFAHDDFSLLHGPMPHDTPFDSQHMADGHRFPFAASVIKAEPVTGSNDTESTSIPANIHRHGDVSSGDVQLTHDGTTTSTLSSQLFPGHDRYDKNGKGANDHPEHSQEGDGAHSPYLYPQSAKPQRDTRFATDESGVDELTHVMGNSTNDMERVANAQNSDLLVEIPSSPVPNSAYVFQSGFDSHESVNSQFHQQEEGLGGQHDCQRFEIRSPQPDRQHPASSVPSSLTRAHRRRTSSISNVLDFWKSPTLDPQWAPIAKRQRGNAAIVARSRLYTTSSSEAEESPSPRAQGSHECRESLVGDDQQTEDRSRDQAGPTDEIDDADGEVAPRLQDSDLCRGTATTSDLSNPPKCCVKGDPSEHSELLTALPSKGQTTSAMV